MQMANVKTDWGVAISNALKEKRQTVLLSMALIVRLSSKRNPINFRGTGQTVRDPRFFSHIGSAALTLAATFSRANIMQPNGEKHLSLPSP